MVLFGYAAATRAQGVCFGGFRCIMVCTALACHMHHGLSFVRLGLVMPLACRPANAMYRNRDCFMCLCMIGVGVGCFKDDQQCSMCPCNDGTVILIIMLHSVAPVYADGNSIVRYTFLSWSGLSLDSLGAQIVLCLLDKLSLCSYSL